MHQVDYSINELSEHVMKDTTILVVGDLRLSIKSHLSYEFLSRAYRDFHFLSNLKVSICEVDSKGFKTLKAKTFTILTCFELQRKDSHSKEVTSMNSFIALSNNSFNSLEIRSLGSPIS